MDELNELLYKKITEITLSDRRDKFIADIAKIVAECIVDIIDRINEESDGE